MTYPNTPGYQAHSDTSKEAAEKLTTSNSMENKIVLYMREYPSGFTADEMRECLESTFPGAQSGTYAARFRGLELKGIIKKTSVKRMTRNRRSAFVYVHTCYEGDKYD